MNVYELTDEDGRIVDMANEDVGADKAEGIRQIHREALTRLGPQLDALQRAVAMRERALVQLEGK